MTEETREGLSFVKDYIKRHGIIGYIKWVIEENSHDGEFIEFFDEN